MLSSSRFLGFFISLAVNLIEGLLSLRIIFKLFGASTTAAFVRWIYETTEPLLTPFAGMFPSPKFTGGFVIEFSSLVALVVYAFIGYLLIEIMDMLARRSSRRTGEVED